ncbi:MAG: hypothetical protein ACK4ML_00770 [Alishewanella aestuarii]
MGRIFDGLTQGFLNGLQMSQQTPYKIAQIELEGERYRDSRDFRNKQFEAQEAQRRIDNDRLAADQRIRQQTHAQSTQEYNYKVNARNQQYAFDLDDRLASAKTDEERDAIFAASINGNNQLARYLIPNLRQLHGAAEDVELVKLPNGNFAVEIVKLDGTRAPLTENRSKDPNDKVVEFSSRELREMSQTVMRTIREINKLNPQLASDLQQIALAVNHSSVPTVSEEFEQVTEVLNTQGPAAAAQVAQDLLGTIGFKDAMAPGQLAAGFKGGVEFTPPATPRESDHPFPDFSMKDTLVGLARKAVPNASGDHPLAPKRAPEATSSSSVAPKEAPRISDAEVSKSPTEALTKLVENAESPTNDARGRRAITTAAAKGPQELSPSDWAHMAERLLHRKAITFEQAVRFIETGFLDSQTMNMSYLPQRMQAQIDAAEAKAAQAEIKRLEAEDKEYANKRGKVYQHISGIFKSSQMNSKDNPLPASFIDDAFNALGFNSIGMRRNDQGFVHVDPELQLDFLQRTGVLETAVPVYNKLRREAGMDGTTAMISAFMAAQRNAAELGKYGAKQLNDIRTQTASKYSLEHNIAAWAIATDNGREKVPTSTLIELGNAREREFRKAVDLIEARTGRRVTPDQISNIHTMLDEAQVRGELSKK